MERINKALKMVYIALATLQQHGIKANRSGAIYYIAPHGSFLALFDLPIGAKGL
jgi:hypothetical protein